MNDTTDTSTLNCWIDRDGTIHPIGRSDHAAAYARNGKRLGYCIRVSLPEGRRTYAGVETRGEPTPAACDAARRIVRRLRRNDYQIVASIRGETIEVMPWDRPTKLNGALH